MTDSSLHPEILGKCVSAWHPASVTCFKQKRMDRGYFSFTKSERIGIVCLVCILLTVIVVPKLFSRRQTVVSEKRPPPTSALSTADADSSGAIAATPVGRAE